jgi:hypothetical protein
MKIIVKKSITTRVDMGLRPPRVMALGVDPKKPLYAT